MVNGARHYLETQIKTASKEELLLMLLDGAVRFAEQGKAKMLDTKIEESHNLIIKAQKIVLELVSAMDKDAIDEKLYSNLASLYIFVYNRMIAANVKKDTSYIDEAIRILCAIRDMWRDAVKVMREQIAGGEITTDSAFNYKDRKLSIQG